MTRPVLSGSQSRRSEPFRDGAAAAGQGARECRLPAGISRQAAHRCRHPCDVDGSRNFLPGSVAHLEGQAYARPLPAENATLTPQPGDIVLVLRAAARVGRQSQCDLRHRPLLRSGRAPSVPDRLACRQRRRPGASRRARAPRGRLRHHPPQRRLRCHVQPDGGLNGRRRRFELYDLRVEVGRPEGKPIYCGAKPGDYFELKGEMLSTAAGPGFFDLFARRRAAAACRPSSARRIRMTGCRPTPRSPVPIPTARAACASSRTGKRRFCHAETTAVPLPKDE